MVPLRGCIAIRTIVKVGEVGHELLYYSPMLMGMNRPQTCQKRLKGPKK